jgi:energy-coupling factor transporter transmembrane protein EcfT
MLGLATGMQVPPAIKALIGALVLVVGLMRHGAAGLIVMGAVALAWAAIDAVGMWRRSRRAAARAAEDHV